MKKLIASLFTVALMATGLVIAQGTPAATAADHATSYAPSVGTVTKVAGKRKAHVGKRVKLHPVVSNGAKGTVTVTVRRGKKLVKRVTRTVETGLTVRFKAKKAGKYKVKAVFHPAAGSVFKASTSRVKVIRVK
jgi:uncharacterized protein (DUF2147 family)